MAIIVYKFLDFNAEELYIVGNLSIFGIVVALQLPDDFKKIFRGRKAKAKNNACFISIIHTQTTLKSFHKNARQNSSRYIINRFSSVTDPLGKPIFMNIIDF